MARDIPRYGHVELNGIIATDAIVKRGRSVLHSPAGHCVGCAIVKSDHAPDCGVAQGLFMESLGTMARRRKRWKRNLGKK